MLSNPNSLVGNSLLPGGRMSMNSEFFGSAFSSLPVAPASEGRVGPGDGRICHNEAGIPVPTPWTRYQAKGSP